MRLRMLLFEQEYNAISIYSSGWYFLALRDIICFLFLALLIYLKQGHIPWTFFHRCQSKGLTLKLKKEIHGHCLLLPKSSTTGSPQESMWGDCQVCEKWVSFLDRKSHISTWVSYCRYKQLLQTSWLTMTEIYSFKILEIRNSKLFSPGWRQGGCMPGFP